MRHCIRLKGERCLLSSTDLLGKSSAEGLNLVLDLGLEGGGGGAAFVGGSGEGGNGGDHLRIFVCNSSQELSAEKTGHAQTIGLVGYERAAAACVVPN
jgi:hypothetical protein